MSGQGRHLILYTPCCVTILWEHGRGVGVRFRIREREIECKARPCQGRVRVHQRRPPTPSLDLERKALSRQHQRDLDSQPRRVYPRNACRASEKRMGIRQRHRQRACVVCRTETRLRRLCTRIRDARIDDPVPWLGRGVNGVCGGD